MNTNHQDDGLKRFPPEQGGFKLDSSSYRNARQATGTRLPPKPGQAGTSAQKNGLLFPIVIGRVFQTDLLEQGRPVGVQTRISRVLLYRTG
jgi:hypothetical protein